jgi:hypothetical protein
LGRLIIDGERLEDMAHTLERWAFCPVQWLHHRLFPGALLPRS